MKWNKGEMAMSEVQNQITAKFIIDKITEEQIKTFDGLIKNIERLKKGITEGNELRFDGYGLDRHYEMTRDKLKHLEQSKIHFKIHNRIQ